MLRPPLHTLGVDERGETALALLPAPSVPKNSVLIYAKSLRASDAWTGTCLRVVAEYHCDVLGNPVTLDSPTNDRAQAQLCDLFGQLPANSFMTRPAPGSGRGLALLPSFRIEDAETLDNASATINVRAGAYGKTVARTVAAAAEIFGDNALTHGRTSPIGVVTTVAYEPSANAMHVVSTDLGADITAPKDAEAFLVSVYEHSIATYSNLAHLVNTASRRGLSVSLMLASGPGRLWWREGIVSSSTTAAVPGFTQALTISDLR